MAGSAETRFSRALSQLFAVPSSLYSLCPGPTVTSPLVSLTNFVTRLGRFPRPRIRMHGIPMAPFSSRREQGKFFIYSFRILCAINFLYQ